MASLARPSISQSDLRVRRKPAPFLDLSLAERYPPADPSDPFAPLWVLRSRTSSAQLLQRHTIYNLSNDGRRQSAFNLRPAPYISNLSEDDLHCVVSDSEHTYSRQSRRQSRARQRSHSMALLTSGTSHVYEFPSVYSRHERPSTGRSERSYSGTDVDMRTRALHIPSDASPAQKKLSQILKPKKLSALMHPHSPRVHKASISGPVLASAPPAMKTISLMLQASITDPQRSAATVPILHEDRPPKLSKVRMASHRPSLGPAEGAPRRPLGDDPRSVSHSALIHISYPTPSTAYPQNIHDEAYTSPRPAPKPPQGPAPVLPLTTVNESEPRKASRPQQKCSISKSKPLPVTPPAQTEWALPTYEQLTRAASLLVIAESGVRISFGSLFEQQRTIVIFIRHFWCPLCQDYMSSVRSFVRPDVLKSPSALNSDGGPTPKLVIISNGSQAMISKYRQIFRMPFEMYTDPTLAVYTTLGMGRGKPDVDYPSCSLRTEGMLNEPTTEKRKKDNAIENGGYVKHGTVGGIVMVALRALKVGMPVWEKGGDVAQLGGEFVLGPGLSCLYAHRMQSPKGHAPIKDVVKAALEIATKNTTAEKMKPLPAVASFERVSPCQPLEAIGKDMVEDSTCSFELVTTEAHVETHEEQDERMISQELRLPPVTTDEDADNASVMATCSEYEESEGSTMLQSTESEGRPHSESN